MPGAAEGARGAWPFAALAGFVLGSALQLQQPDLWAWPAYTALAFAGSVGVLAGGRSRSNWSKWLLLAVMASGSLFGAGLAGGRASIYAADELSPALEGRDLEVVGVVAQMPQRFEGGVRFRLDVESVLDLGAQDIAPLPPRIAIGWYADSAGATPGAPHAGERWRMTVRLKAPHGGINPHGFDFELWMWEQGVQASGYVRGASSSGQQPVRLGSTWRHPLERAREATRDAIFQRVADPQWAGVIAALVTGDQAAIDRSDWDVFRATGVAHLMSISGLHVTMFAWLATWLVGAAWRRSARLMLHWPAQHAGLVGGVALATLYAAFSGWGVPSQRTMCMLAALALLRISGMRWPWPCVWLLACGVVVAVDPWALMQAGFWLSFVAVGVLFAADYGAHADDKSGWRSAPLRMLREQWVVTLALTPLSLLLFQQVSVVGLLANLLAIPWVTLVVTPLAMLGVAVHPVWDAAAWAVEGLVTWLQVLASVPWATVSLPQPPLWAAAAGVAGGVLVAMRLPWTLRLLGLPLLMPAVLWQSPRPAPGEFELLAADVGQGSAIVVRTATHSLLYDAGPRYGADSDAGQRVVVPLLRSMGERLDVVVLSHRDSDHTGGAPAVLAMQPHAALLSSIEREHPLQRLRPARRCEAGQRWEWDGVRFDVLHPLAGDYAQAGVKSNALSCVLRVSSGARSALLAGDIEREQELSLVRRGVELHADVLFAPHHGSKSSSSASFLDAVQPQLAVVQAGYRNRFGHPAPEVVARYRQRDIAIADTPRCGAVRWRSEDPANWSCQRETARRYWHHRIPPMTGQ
ncbi:DNA internalization-related competence protein ComEC/Rec2 [Variovorax sp. J22R133]|uniref:DNA internalization-related competence protein ComEC/Rec2 n=1 Tax=Variovorax brevis TaxID=3053503 RepID=UPI0025776DC9|nr:DNA internalization-related competence protein ComEC/Rec2 [Variovorax sp. J22R133]MDM0113049.1 DNA internalization-related competence protein ComEC/Rec2 [Variovorax sp. J22R133]